MSAPQGKTEKNCPKATTCVFIEYARSGLAALFRPAALLSIFCRLSACSADLRGLSLRMRLLQKISRKPEIILAGEMQYRKKSMTRKKIIRLSGLHGKKPFSASGFTRSSIGQMLKDSFKNIESNPFPYSQVAQGPLLEIRKHLLQVAKHHSWQSCLGYNQIVAFFQFDVHNRMPFNNIGKGERIRGQHQILSLFCLDDIAFSSNDLASINELKRRLRTRFDMKDLGDSTKSFLEIKVMRSQRVLEPSASIHWIYCQKLVFLHANRNKI
uniref:Reverse transcriptase Ty1/copia-type domain-containing protein n=1 Tax=Solanum lycopersicum TaxID=4081 RepID=A0A3Q7IUG6_SOLLC